MEHGLVVRVKGKKALELAMSSRGREQKFDGNYVPILHCKVYGTCLHRLMADGAGQTHIGWVEVGVRGKQPLDLFLTSTELV